jgi:MFS family permease
LGVIGPSLLPHASSDQPSQLFVWPRGKVLLIGVLCFILFLMEGAILDWSALVLTTRQGLDPSRAGLGYAVFAITMTIGRLTGDRAVSLLGSRTIMLAGGSIAMIGILVAVWSPDWPLSLFGFALVGIGAANIVPVLFSAIGHQTVMPSSLAVSAVTTLGYLGILIGPALIGPIAQISNLAIAFSGIAALLILVLLNSRIHEFCASCIETSARAIIHFCLNRRYVHDPRPLLWRLEHAWHRTNVRTRRYPAPRSDRTLAGRRSGYFRCRLHLDRRRPARPHDSS